LVTTKGKTASNTNADDVNAPTTVKKAAPAKPTFASVKALLVKNTCIACHNETKRQVGPAYVDVAKRRYSVNQIISLVRNPRKENWPDYETQMPPMPQVPRADLQKIALWIKSLEK
jgi:cytochrome c551/c552